MKLPSWVITESPVEEETFPCKKCGKKMVERRNGKTGDYFWGCSAFPECRHTETEHPDDHGNDEYDEWHPGHPSNYGSN
jgi:ssDNA-binding Zn-finger/Zn-ribbon topoisomerase 1